MLLTGCGHDYNEAIDAWNTRSKQVVENYNSLKELAMPYEKQFIDMYLYNYASDDLAQFFNESKIPDSMEEGFPDYSYYDKVKLYQYKDTYDDVIRKQASYAGMFLEDYCEALAKGEISDYGYTLESVGLHEFFTSAYMSTQTEIYALECVNGAEVKVIVTWQDNKIIEVCRYL